MSEQGTPSSKPDKRTKQELVAALQQRDAELASQGEKAEKAEAKVAQLRATLVSRLSPPLLLSAPHAWLTPCTTYRRCTRRRPQPRASSPSFISSW